MKKRHRYVDISELSSGAVLAQSITLAEHGIVTYSLPQGHALTQQNIEQLALHDALCACVDEDDPRTEDEINAYVQRQTGRLQMIFKPSDLSAPETRNLFDALLAYRTA